MQHTFTYHQDPGHGWIECKLDEIKRLGITDQISRYSYLKGQVAYLEEDCDAGLLINAKKANGERYTIKEVHSNHDSFIRNLNRFEAATA